MNEYSIYDLPTIAPMLLEQAEISLLQSTTGTLLLIHCKQEAPIDPMLYLDLVPIARLVQESFGVTQICICNIQRDVTLHWSSQELIGMAKVWRI
ncbi:MAG: hypothetical protein KME10_26650 [Plectolyngbya sp. WJT66-NPBG17]|jgi:hypothetical protein|nr:hypothetical protein [Plectolyngbya sp. WJT66-NPBG17]MBW4528741.1 hypothetical protein [Phormidium tanganyikae FI6-MK23]